MRGIGRLIAGALAVVTVNEMFHVSAARDVHRHKPRKKNIEPPPHKTLPVPDRADWWVDPRKTGKRKSRALKGGEL